MRVPVAVEQSEHVAVVEPVEALIERRCRFKSRGKNDHGHTLPGCEYCRRGRLHVDHLGAPPSMNDGGSGMDRMAYQSLKKAWMAAITAALIESRLPRGLESVVIEVLIGFDQYRERDEGNHRWMIEKATGDALVEGGWLPDDSFWPTRRYSMGNLEGRHTPGESWTRLRVFPSMQAPVCDPRAGQVSLLSGASGESIA